METILRVSVGHLQLTFILSYSAARKGTNSGIFDHTNNDCQQVDFYYYYCYYCHIYLKPILSSISILDFFALLFELISININNI